jgi:cell division protein FtsI/penicillin-binding protein 2
MMISGMNINVALYRSILVFMILFTVVYLSVFFLNIIQDKNAKSEGSAVAQGNNPQNSKEN